MENVKVGAVIYDPKVTVIWEMIAKFAHERDLDLEPVFYKDYKLQIDGLESGEIDLGWNSPLAHLDAHIRFEGNEKYSLMRDWDQGVKSVCVAKADSDITEIGDLRNKTVGFGAIDSPQARLIPINLMHKSGLEFGSDYKDVRFDVGVGLHGDHVGGEKDALVAFNNGELDATWMLIDNYNAWITDGSLDKNATRIVVTTPEYDHCIFTASPSVSDEKIKAFETCMLKMDYSNPDHKEIMDMEGLKEWLPGRTSGFKQITEANEYLNFLSEFNASK